MAFSFGNTSNQSAFGSTPAKPTGFGTPFSATPATTASTSFGFGSTFGAPATNPPAFGSTFGTPATSAPPSFGSTFGTPASSAPGFGTAPSSAPAFGSTFGAATTTTPSFGSTFGQPAAGGNATGLFGQTTKPSLFGAPTSTPSLFTSSSGTGLFGGTATSQAPSLFGANTSTTPSLFGQPAASSAPAPSLFGSGFGAATATSTAPNLFGAGGTGTTNTFGSGGLFGAATTTTASLFGGFGTGSTTQTGFSGFGGGTTGSTFGFGASTQQQPGGLFGPRPSVPGISQVPAINRNQQVAASVYAINVFNDERDDILKKWNMLQASWGTGKGYYNSTQPPIEYNFQNPFYRFKAMGYNVIPEQDNSEGVVKLVFNKKVADLRNQSDVLKNGIGGILGNKPNLTVDILQIRAISDNSTEVRITVSEKGVTGSSRKIPATDLAAYLNQPTQKQQLTNVGVLQITPFVTPSKAELEEYLKNPPSGIDRQMWEAAITDNPNPKKYIPVAINGFTDLKSRMLNQEYQTGLHQAFLDKVNSDINDLKNKHASSIAQISELKQKFMELQHRILRILVKQESTRKLGLALQPEEEIIRGRLELIHSHLNMPKQFKGQIHELLSHIKMIDRSPASQSHYRIDTDAQEEIKQFLKMEQNGIAQLINIINTDLQAIKIINEGMQQMLQSHNNVRLT